MLVQTEFSLYTEWIKLVINKKKQKTINLLFLYILVDVMEHIYEFIGNNENKNGALYMQEQVNV